MTDNVSVEDLINALGSGNKADANDVFSTLMGNKINDAMDDKRAEIANSFSGVAEAPVEIEDEQVDDDIQAVPDDESE